VDYALAADVLAGFHLAIVLYVLVGQLLIVTGGLLRWGWVRNFWFRISHFAVILVVALESSFGVLCPLTTWEHDLRVKAGEEGQEGSFVGNLLHDILFVDVTPETMNIVYVAFALVVLGCFFVIPPRRRSAVEGS